MSGQEGLRNRFLFDALALLGGSDMNVFGAATPSVSSRNFALRYLSKPACRA
jgi:hypothetical protein